MNNSQLVPSVARLVPNTGTHGSRNVYQNMSDHTGGVIFFVVLWLILIGMVMTGTVLAIYAVILMFPASLAIAGFAHTIPRYVQGKMLTRICEPGSDMWRSIALAYTTAGTRLAIFLAVLAYPFWMPVLWIQDLKRLATAVKMRSKGEPVSLGSDEFIFYKKQAKKYNQLLQSQGRAAAEEFLAFTTILTDIPNAAEITDAQWQNGVRDEIVAYKERKYGPMSDYGV